AASAMAAMARYKALRERPQGKTVTFEVDQPRARRVVARARRAGRIALTASEVQEMLAAYGFPLVPSATAASPAEAMAAARKLGYPVVLKALSDRIAHKSDVGGVKVDLRTADEVGAAYD